MATRIYPVRAGLVLGSFLGGLHFAWAFAVAWGFAQPLINFIFWVHFIKPVYIVQPFNIWTAAILVGLMVLAGYGAGWVLAVLWNGIHRES